MVCCLTSPTRFRNLCSTALRTFSRSLAPFFHYVSWVTGGQECVSDLQGLEDEDGSVILCNPCMPRRTGWGAGSCFGPPGPGGGANPQLFDRLHPKCGPLCKSFDPDRRTKPGRRNCGVPISCGFNAPGCAGGGSQKQPP